MEKIKLNGVATLITKGTTPSSIGGQFTDSGINFIKSESICGSKYLKDNIYEHIDEETDKKLKRSRLTEGDLHLILFSPSLNFLTYTVSNLVCRIFIL